MDDFIGDESWGERANQLRADRDGNARKLEEAQTLEEKAKYTYHFDRARVACDRHYVGIQG